ncbi:hypothetical protein S40293_10261 [Stachybotrys chartarum IBT 40293]|nr:hypothetical protein S40293_10261 [Stachybotrys chartarum IBT 40293]
MPQHHAHHERIVERLYELLEKEARLVDVSPETGIISRTAVAATYSSTETILAKLLSAYPKHAVDSRLTCYAGSRLADDLSGRTDGIKLIFGTDEGRESVAALYGDLLLNKLAIAQMVDMLKRLVSKIRSWDGLLRIMELDAGTGCTPKSMVPMLASLGIQVEYTFTDLSGPFVAAARKTFGKEYSPVHEISDSTHRTATRARPHRVAP